MDGIHPKFVLSKRFPVHAAIEQLDLHALQQLLTPVSDARFHFGRKLTGTEVSVLHQACGARPTPRQAVLDIVRLCTALGAPVNDADSAGQTPLHYAVSHCMADQLVPLLLRAGEPNTISLPRPVFTLIILFVCNINEIYFLSRQALRP